MAVVSGEEPRGVAGPVAAGDGACSVSPLAPGATCCLTLPNYLYKKKQYINSSFPQNLNVMFETHLKHQKQSEDGKEDHLLGHVGRACCPPGIWRGTERGTVL